MFDKEIEFSAHEDYFALKENHPIPSTQAGRGNHP
jgi:hypothetical protein